MQGLADLATGLMGALGSTLGGMILQSWGFPILNGVGLLLVLGPLAAAWLGRAALSARRSIRLRRLPPPPDSQLVRLPTHASGGAGASSWLASSAAPDTGSSSQLQLTASNNSRTVISKPGSTSSSPMRSSPWRICRG